MLFLPEDIIKHSFQEHIRTFPKTLQFSFKERKFLRLGPHVIILFTAYILPDVCVNYLAGEK